MTDPGAPPAAEALISTRIKEVLAAAPDGRAIQYEGEWWTWREVGEVVAALDEQLTAAGLPSGAAVGLVMRNRPGTMAALLGLLATGRCALFVTPIQPDRAMVEEVRTLRPAALMADAEDWERHGLRDAAAAVGALGIELPRRAGEAVRALTGLALVRGGGHCEVEPGVALSLLTSGTTGPPKRVPCRFDRLDAVCLGSPAGDPLHPRGVTINAMPLVAVGAALGLARTMWRGRPMALLERFDVWRWSALVREHRPRVAGAPPAVVRMVMEADVPVEWFESVECFVTGSAPLDPELQVAFEEKYRLAVLLRYGATEFFGLAATWTMADWERWHEAKVGSVGRAVPGVDLRIVDADTGAERPPGEVGLLEVRPAWATSTGELGWLATNDLAHVDEDGFLWLAGRADDVLIRGGFKVPVGEVEAVLREHPKVVEALVVGLDDERLGQVPAAAVVLAPGTDPSVLDALRPWLVERLAPYKVPERIVALAEIPRNEMLKPLRREVRARLMGAVADPEQEEAS